MRKLGFIVIILIPYVVIGQTEKLEFQQIYFKTQQTLTRLADGIYPTKNNKLIASFRKLEKTGTRLFNVLGDLEKVDEIDQHYLKTLQRNQEVLEKTISIEDRGKVIKLFNYTQRDYDNKLKSISYGLRSNTNTDAKIKVTTKKEGYTAYIKYTSDFDENIVRFYFNNKTNDAERELAPGFYLVWVEKGDYKSEERFVDIIAKDADYVNLIKF